MKKVLLTLILALAYAISFAQTPKALVIKGSSVEIGDFNPSTATVFNKQTAGTILGNFKPRDIIYDGKNGNIIFQNNSKGLVFCKIQNNVITTKNMNQENTVMAPAYIPTTQKIVCFNVQKTFNGYGSNEENLFLSSVDVKTGLSKNLLEFTDLSFDNVSAPFYGKVDVQDRFAPGSMREKDVAISKPLFVAEKDLYIILIRDVTGTNRLYKIKLNTANTNVSSNRCEYNIIDMVYMPGTDVAKALYFENSGSEYVLKAGDFNISTNQMSNMEVIKTFSAISSKAIIDNGSIKFNTEGTQLFVSHFEGITTSVYNLDIKTNAPANDVQKYNGYVQYDFGFNESAYKILTYSDVFKLYPNPSTGVFHFKNQSGVMPYAIYVYDYVGQVVKMIKVDGNFPQLDIDLSEMARGIYTIRVDMPDEDFTGKVILTH